jgi:hypothetical protein
MKTEKERRERLLSDVFAENFDTTEQARRDINPLLREFRLTYWRRKTNRVLLAVAAMVAIGVFTSLYTRKTERPNQTAVLPTPSPSNPQLSATSAITPKSPDYLTDKELLSLFPPESCFLAELDGKQVLVFKDPAMAAAVLH